MFILGKSALVAFLLVVGSASIVKADQLYVEGANDNFGLLNPQTGAYTLIGVTSELIGGMGFGADGSLYGLGDNAVLYRINTSNGALTTIANTGLTLSGGYGMGATQDGTLYLVDNVGGTGSLYTVNPTNAHTTFLSNPGFNSNCDPVGDAAGNLYNGQGTYGSGFYAINRTTGVGTLLGSASYGNVGCLAFTDGTMYAMNTTGSIYNDEFDQWGKHAPFDLQCGCRRRCQRRLQCDRNYFLRTGSLYVHHLLTGMRAFRRGLVAVSASVA